MVRRIFQGAVRTLSITDVSVSSLRGRGSTRGTSRGLRGLAVPDYGRKECVSLQCSTCSWRGL